MPYAIQAATATAAGSLSGTLPASQLTGTLSTNNFAAGSITSTMLASGAVGSDQLADGAVTAGKMATALDGLLATTIANPTPAASDNFGISVSAVGTELVVIGAHQDGTAGPSGAGAAYLFSTNGTLLANDSDPDADALTLTSLDATTAHGGTVTLDAGWVCYVPPADLNGADSFAYILTDAEGHRATNTVTIQMEGDAGGQTRNPSPSPPCPTATS